MSKADKWLVKIEKELKSSQKKCDIPDTVIELVNELKIHQTELETTNEELKKSQKELSALYEQYYDLYNDVPIGYLTLDMYDIILNVNDTAAELLELKKDSIIGRGFGRFISKDSENVYYTLLAQSAATLNDQKLDIKLKRGNEIFDAHLEIHPKYGKDK